ncbi:hypothetical protein [Arthrobacter cheniae]|nr:hypothetical protein [Arthrobacter cheniae]
MEGTAALGLIVLLFIGTEQASIAEHATVFALPYLQENLYLMIGMSGIFGVLRIIGAVALWRNRLWGAGLSIAMCLVTLSLMIFLLPAGLADGLLSGTALVLILHSWLGRDQECAVRAIIS